MLRISPPAMRVSRRCLCLDIEPCRDRRADLRRQAGIDDPTSAGIYCEVTPAQIDYALKAGTRTPPPSSPSLEETYAARPVHRLCSVAHARRGRRLGRVSRLRRPRGLSVAVLRRPP